MAGARIEIELDTEAVLHALHSAAASIEGEPRTVMLEDMGQHLLDSTRERAEREVSPEGVRWKELSPRYATRKAKKRPGMPILKFDFHMLGDQLSYQVADDILRVGTAAKYGAIQQFGGTPDMAPGPAAIRARPWLGLDDTDEDKLVAILHDHLDAALDIG